MCLLLGQMQIVSNWKLFSFFLKTNLLPLLVSSDQPPMENLRHIELDFLETGKFRSLSNTLSLSYIIMGPEKKYLKN